MQRSELSQLLSLTPGVREKTDLQASSAAKDSAFIVYCFPGLFNFILSKPFKVTCVVTVKQTFPCGTVNDLPPCR